MMLTPWWWLNFCSSLEDTRKICEKDLLRNNGRTRWGTEQESSQTKFLGKEQYRGQERLTVADEREKEKKCGRRGGEILIWRGKRERRVSKWGLALIGSGLWLVNVETRGCRFCKVGWREISIGTYDRIAIANWNHVPSTWLLCSFPSFPWFLPSRCSTCEFFFLPSLLPSPLSPTSLSNWAATQRLGIWSSLHCLLFFTIHRSPL